MPYLGICLGMQLAVIEYARNVAGLEGANTTEIDDSTKHPVIALITEWQNKDGSTEKRSEDSDLGGTMRLGAQTCKLKEGSITRGLYNSDTIVERHRHRWEVNGNYIERLKQAGLIVSGVSADQSLVEVVEIADHPWFVACQFHPEFTSRPRGCHPLFSGYISAALKYARAK